MFLLPCKRLLQIPRVGVQKELGHLFPRISEISAKRNNLILYTRGKTKQKTTSDETKLYQNAMTSNLKENKNKKLTPALQQ